MTGAYTPGSGVTPNNSMMAWGGAGMAGWGSTCGIALGCAQFTEFALPRAQTNGAIDKIFAYYAEGSHPFNADWFISGKTNPRAATDFQISYGSLQCHNVISQHRNRGDFLDECGGDPAASRMEFCSTLVGAMIYETLKQVGSLRGGFTAPAFTPFSTVRNSCSEASCHGNYLTASYIPKEDCYACHK